MYKLVAVDLDGTLLNQYGVVTDYTKEVLKKVQDKGIEVMIASGRPNDSIQAIAKEINSEHYFISGNGAIIYDIQKGEVLYEQYMTKQKVLEIIAMCEENSITYNIYTETAILATALKYNVLYYHKENLKKEVNKQTTIILVDNMKEYVSEMKEDTKFLKITVCDEDQAIFNSIIRKLRTISGIEVLDVLHMSRKMIRQGTEDVSIDYHYTEISLENVDKWSALLVLMEKLGISPEEVITIGDNINDKQMIEHAGLRNRNGAKYANYQGNCRLYYCSK